MWRSSRSYWQSLLSTDRPAPRQILDLLILREHWGGGDELETFDFTLPEEVTDYVIAVSFDGAGEVSTIRMES